MKNPAKQAVYRALKADNCQTFQELMQSTGLEIDVLTMAIGEIEREGYLEYRQGRYCLYHVLLPLPTVKHLDFKYETLRKTPMGIGEPAEPIDPGDIAPADQKDIGSCVGQGIRQGADANYIQLTGIKPTEEDKSHYRFDVLDDNNLLHDHLYPQSFSAWCAYIWSREEGNVWQPEGSYPSYAVRALQNRGICFEDQWPSAKTKDFTYDSPPVPAVVDAEAPLHKITGYAQAGDTFDQLKADINAKGFAVIAVYVYDNYGSMKGGDGTFPEPPENPDNHIAGGHCLFAYKREGCDSDEWIHILHSWDGWCGREGKFSRNYANVGLIPAENYVFLDEEETERLREGFVTVNVTTNVPAIVSVDGEKIGDTTSEVTTTLEVGRMYRFYAEPQDTTYYPRGEHVVPEKDTTVVNITLSTEPEPEPGDNWFLELLELILKFLEEWLSKLKFWGKK
jgi:hypothetical protein